jgi:hypothetical protein
VSHARNTGIGPRQHRRIRGRRRAWRLTVETILRVFDKDPSPNVSEEVLPRVPGPMPAAADTRTLARCPGFRLQPDGPVFTTPRGSSALTCLPPDGARARRRFLVDLQRVRDGIVLEDDEDQGGAARGRAIRSRARRSQLCPTTA